MLKPRNSEEIPGAGAAFLVGAADADEVVVSAILLVEGLDIVVMGMEVVLSVLV